MQNLSAWLKEKLYLQYGALAAEIERGYATNRRTTFRVNSLNTDSARVESELRGAGLSFRRVDWYPEAYLLQEGTERDLSALPCYREGGIYVQSLSSMLPPLYLGAEAGESVLDMTAAPGGKTTQISALTGGKAFITACEKDKIRADRLRFNIERQRAPRVTVLQTDARGLDDFFSFDRILLDAPCSGSGTLDLNAPIRISEALVANSSKLQEQLLFKAMKLLKKGGVLVYSTCSVLKEENELVLERAIRQAGGELIPIAPPEGAPLLPSLAGTVCVCPNELFEGFFVAKIIKK